VKTIPGKGRVLTSQGRALLDKIAYEVMQEVVKEKPELIKYLSPSRVDKGG